MPRCTHCPLSMRPVAFNCIFCKQMKCVLWNFWTLNTMAGYKTWQHHHLELVESISLYFMKR